MWSLVLPPPRYPAALWKASVFLGLRRAVAVGVWMSWSYGPSLRIALSLASIRDSPWHCQVRYRIETQILLESGLMSQSPLDLSSTV